MHLLNEDKTSLFGKFPFWKPISMKWRLRTKAVNCGLAQLSAHSSWDNEAHKFLWQRIYGHLLHRDFQFNFFPPPKVSRLRIIILIIIMIIIMTKKYIASRSVSPNGAVRNMYHLWNLSVIKKQYMQIYHESKKKCFELFLKSSKLLIDLTSSKMHSRKEQGETI